MVKISPKDLGNYSSLVTWCSEGAERSRRAPRAAGKTQTLIPPSENRRSSSILKIPIVLGISRESHMCM